MATEGREETREQELARVRSYLASQSVKRTPAQLVEAVREAHRQRFPQHLSPHHHRRASGQPPMC